MQRNSFLAMIIKDRRPIRELGLRRIIEARKVKSNSVRVFKLPKLNFQAADYIDIILDNVVILRRFKGNGRKGKVQ